MASVWPLRKAISEGRWAVIGARLSDKAERDELFFMPGIKSSMTDRLDVDDDETNHLHLGFSSVQEVVEQVTGIAEAAIGNEQDNDPNALGAALANLKAALEHSMTEFEEENRLLVSL
jgi:type IV secretion system protein VirD4